MYVACQELYHHYHDGLGQHLLIPCSLSPGENLASEGRRLLLQCKSTLIPLSFWSLIDFCPSFLHSVHIGKLIK